MKYDIRLRLPGTHKLLVAGAVAAALVITGCPKSSTPDSGRDDAEGYDPNAPVTITWWTGQSGESESLLEDLANEFHTMHPNVALNVMPGGTTHDVLFANLGASLTTDGYPDISYAYARWATQLGKSGKTQNLSTFVTGPAMAWDEFPEAARAVATVNNRIIGVPCYVDNLALVYNKAVFDAAGLQYPTDEWSWEDFRAAAKALTSPAKNIYGTAYSVSGSENTTGPFWPMLWQRGGEILDKDTTAFNSDAGIAALEFLRQMAVDDKSVFLDQTDENYRPLFYSGRIAMIISGPWLLHDLKEQNVDYDVAFLPGFDGNHETASDTDLWVLFSHKDPNRAGASREFVRWLTSKEISPRWNLSFGNLPLRSSDEGTNEFAAYVDEFAPGAQKFFDNMTNAITPRPQVQGYVQMSHDVGEAISQVLRGAKTARQALDEAAQRSESALADL